MKAAIFDLDGTLVDSMGLWESLAGNYLLSIGIKPPKDLNSALSKLTVDERILYLKKRFNLKATIEEINQSLEEILTDYYKNRIQLKPYVREILEKFKSKNIIMALATATDEHFVSMVLDRHKIRKYFKFIQTSKSVGLSKSQPEFFQIAIERLGLQAKEIWVFEDALHCMVSAKECGLNIVAVEDKWAFDDLKKIKEISDIYIEDFSQLEVEKLWKNY